LHAGMAEKQNIFIPALEILTIIVRRKSYSYNGEVGQVSTVADESRVRSYVRFVQ
jgi:hypothetical protein